MDGACTIEKRAARLHIARAGPDNLPLQLREGFQILRLHPVFDVPLPAYDAQPGAGHVQQDHIRFPQKTFIRTGAVIDLRLNVPRPHAFHVLRNRQQLLLRHISGQYVSPTGLLPGQDALPTRRRADIHNEIRLPDAGRFHRQHGADVLYGT